VMVEVPSEVSLDPTVDGVGCECER
jgi:hypothetical protein